MVDPDLGGSERNDAVTGSRVTEIGRWEVFDRRSHPVVALLALTVLVAVFVTGLVGLGVAVRDSDRRVDVPHVVVPPLEGVSEGKAQATLDEVGLLMEVVEAPNELVAPGTVFEQDPISGARLEEGSAVSVGVSTGPAGPVVPDVVGQQITEAQGLLVASGLTAEVTEVPDEEVRVGEVLGTRPAPGRLAGGQGAVEVMVSSGPAPRVVPEVVDRDVLDVLAELGRLRLRPESISRVEESDVADGTVLSIEPGPGTSVARDSDVTLVVAGTPRPVTVPAVEGLLRTTAVEALADSAITASFRVVALPSGDPRDGRVLRQGVAAAAQVPKGTEVEFVIGRAPPPPPTTTAPPSTTTTTTVG